MVSSIPPPTSIASRDSESIRHRSPGKGTSSCSKIPDSDVNGGSDGQRFRVLWRVAGEIDAFYCFLMAGEGGLMTTDIASFEHVMRTDFCSLTSKKTRICGFAFRGTWSEELERSRYLVLMVNC